MTTLKEIAQLANVHLTTVSGILNHSKGNSRCSPETREKVLRIAARLGYVRNQLASRLRSRCTNTICLIAGDVRNPFFSALATAIEEELEAKGYQLVLLCRGWNEEQLSPGLIQSTFEQPVDGFIVWSELVGKTVLSLPRNFPKPIITMGAKIQGFDGVRLDIRHGMRMAMDYLMEKGHRHLAYYAPEEDQHRGLPQPRSVLFTEIALAAGLPTPQIIFYPGRSWDIATARDHAKTVKLSPGTTALLGFNDVAVLGWRSSGNGKNLETVGFDGTDWLKLGRTPIPHIHIPTRKLARLGVELIISQLEGRSRHKSSSILPELIRP